MFSDTLTRVSAEEPLTGIGSDRSAGAISGFSIQLNQGYLGGSETASGGVGEFFMESWAWGVDWLFSAVDPGAAFVFDKLRDSPRDGAFVVFKGVSVCFESWERGLAEVELDKTPGVAVVSESASCLGFRPGLAVSAVFFF